MTTMWDTNKVTIEDLVRFVRQSEIALPQFQRPSVWGKADWLPFLVAVLRGRPAGTLLFLEAPAGDADFAARS